MTHKQKRNLKRIIIALVLFFAILITNQILIHNTKYNNGFASLIGNSYGWILTFSLYFAIYIYIGHDVIRKCFINIMHGEIFDEAFLMTVATIGAFGLGIYTGIKENNPEGFDEACAVLLFYQVGEWFQGYAVGKSRKNITSLMDIRPDYANLLHKDGTIEVVDPTMLNVGDIIVIKPGEKVPVDGRIIEGSTSLDTKALTGESLPQDKAKGDEIISGVINITSVIEVEVLKAFSDSTVSKILELVENASNAKSKSEAFITKFAKYYTPIVVFLAVALAFIPPLVLKSSGNSPEISKWLYRSLSFLVVSCPCALVISVPLTFFAGLGGASRNGILIKGSIHLERFNNANLFVFDKTGTLTKGNFKITKIYPEDNKDEILYYAARAEGMSNHPIAVSIRNEYGKTIDNNYNLEDIAGKGIKAIGEHTILCGNNKLMEAYNIEYNKSELIGTVVHVAVDNKYLGYILIQDEIKDDAKDTINYLNSIGAKTVMLTGDNEVIARHVGNTLGLTEIKASLLPQNKVLEVDNLMKNKKDNELLCFIGDGINDAPVIMKSDIGIAMGGVGSDAAIEASDIVLMHDDLKSISVAKKIAKKTMKIVYENIIFALIVKVLILILSSLGITNMWFAVFGDVGVCVICILNAMRANTKYN